MKLDKEQPMTKEEEQKQIDNQESIESASRTWWDDVPEGMAPHEQDYDSEDYEVNS